MNVHYVRCIRMLLLSAVNEENEALQLSIVTHMGKIAVW